MNDLSKNYKPQDFEQDIYSKWENSGFFNPDNLKSNNEKTFSIVLPPPNATGILHLGHASMLAYQDTMVRYHRMLGERTLWVPGTDHAAIATQNVVEKKIAKEQNKKKEDLGREKFLQEVRNFVTDSQSTIRNQIRRMGASLDWTRESYTLDRSLSLVVRKVFKKMYDDGLIYRGYRIVNWCPRCHSTLADDEVEYETKKTPFYYFKYGPVVIGTARPETKFADKIIIVHPDDDRYKNLIGKRFIVPWIEGQVEAQVIADKKADKELGTGAMTITPAHSFVDYELAQKYNLDIKKIIDEDGNLTDEAGSFSGMNAREAREKIIAKMKEKDLVDRIDEDYEHNLSVCYRCKTPIEPLPSEQWFVDVNKRIPWQTKSLKQLAIKAVDSGIKGKSINIMPDKFSKVYDHWMENLHDWCISRQIWWGHRIPVWQNNKTGEQIVPDKITEIVLSRHGLTDWNQIGQVQGSTDVPIDEQKVDEIKKVAQRFKEEEFDLIITSPLKRARQTAEILAKELGLEIEQNDLLTERNYGEFEGRKVKDLKKEHPDYYKDKINYDIPGEGEEIYEQMSVRVEKFLDWTDKEHGNKKILVITHNALMRTFEMVVNERPASKLSDYKPMFGTPVRYHILDGKYKLADYKQDEDTLDTWFSSALWTFSTLLNKDSEYINDWKKWIKDSPDLKNYHPTSVMETGYDILFFWVARMVLMTTYLLKEVPFENVYLHGLIRDKEGRKMSKSLGNGIDPIEMIDKYGADALRLSMMVGATPGNDVRLYEEKIEGYRNFVNKLWNISRYVLGTVKDVKLVNKIPEPNSLSDQWILEKLNKVIQEVTNHLNNYNFSQAIVELYHFTWGDFADKYIERSKKEEDKDLVLQFVLQQILKLWHPFAPYVTEVIWEQFSNKLLMIERWSNSFELKSKYNVKDFDLINDIVSKVYNLKSAAEIKQNNIIKASYKGMNDFFEKYVDIIKEEAKINFVNDKGDSWTPVDVSGVLMFVDIDKNKIDEKINKQKAELEKNIASIEKKLANEQFVKNAPAEVVQKEKDKLDKAKDELSKL